MKDELKLTWIGPWIPQSNLGDWKAASPAAMKWQKHLVEALVEQGVAVNWTFYRPEPYWPRGRIFPEHENTGALLAPSGTESVELPYVNLPVMRRYSLFKSCLERLPMNSEQSRIIVSYNVPEWQKDLISRLRQRSKVCWICIVADSDAPKCADGYVFLSHGYFERFPEYGKKLHLDGGIYPPCKPKNEILRRQKHNKMRFMYSGSLGKWGGISVLLDALRHIDSDEFEVLVSGPGMTKENLRRVNGDSRVVFLGMLGERQLAEAYASIDVFLNPRPTRISGSENNFPSKLLDYLGWGKPIISTWTDGLAPEYRHVLNLVEDDPRSIAAEMIRFIQEGHRFQIPAEWAFRFNKTWDQQAERLSGFIRQVWKNT